MYNVRPSEPPRTQVRWLTQKKCYQGANHSKVLDKAGKLEGYSEYHDEFAPKKTKLEDPVVVHEEVPQKGNKRCFPAAAATRGTSETKKAGIRASVRSSSAPWQGLTMASTDFTKDFNAAAASSPGLRVAPFSFLRNGPIESAEPKQRGLRTSAYCDKYISNVF
eukprot:GGOE01043614.1.p1 GENE.GGOE01043614.1~~GGOE01043614.1.p1  ORF type:complete len:179 (-),score=37.30 GGOE01043614.1:305-796(-)